MKKIRIGLLGFGTVGKGVFQTIQTHQKTLTKTLGKPVEISKIVVENIDKHEDSVNKEILTTNFQEILNDPKINIVIEAIVGIEPAATYLKKALQAGKHVITANKEMFAHHGKELKSLAEEADMKVGYEATTGGGIPIIQTINQLLQVNQIHKVSAILNGTSNYILTEMRINGLSFYEALTQAQKLGFAEADPTNDVEGWDSFYKLMILSELLFAKQPDWNTVKRVGIDKITDARINDLQEKNQRMKLLATLEVMNGTLHAYVEPVILSETHPLFAVEGVSNAIALETDLLGNLTLTGPGAGALPTASAIIEDLCIILKNKWISEFKSQTTVIS
ncbi:MAG TPA: homoserine dehydrogenase [Candidatus Avamphibacillus sp.]|nr:homoserine dehydrogenase [Candidatus Avamphibacillus sp.]